MKKPIIFATIIVVALIFMNLLNFSEAGYTDFDAWAVIDKNVVNYLQNGEDATVDLAFYEADSPIYERLGEIFINQKSDSVDQDFPMYAGESGTQIAFSNSDSSLITPTFASVSTYDGLFLVNGISYNEDLSRADSDDFILVSLDNGTYMLAQNTTVTHIYGTQDISMNAVVYFTETGMNYMEFIDGQYVSESITFQIETIQIGNYIYDYAAFIEKLGLLEDKIDASDTGVTSSIEDEELEEEPEEPTMVEEVEEPEVEIEEPLEDSSIEDTEEENKDTSTSTSTQTGTEQAEGESSDKDSSSDDSSEPSVGEGTGEEGEEGEPGEPGDPIYEMPVITIEENLDTWVYSVTGYITISDPSSRLYRNVTLYVYEVVGDSLELVMRKSVSETGEFTITGLEPETDFVLTATYQQYNDYDVKETVEALEDPLSFTTKSRDYLISMTPQLDSNESYETAEIYSDKIEINDIYFLESVEATTSTEDTTSTQGTVFDTIDAVDRIVIEITDEDGNVSEKAFPSSYLTLMKAGETVDWLSNAEMFSQTEYTYTLKYYDDFNVELPMTEAAITSGYAKTCKVDPTANVYVSSTAVSNIKATVTIFNQDLAEIEDAYIQVLDSDGNIVEIEGYLEDDTYQYGSKWYLGTAEETSQNFSVNLTNLSTSQIYYIQVWCESYDIKDGNTYEDMLLTSMACYTSSIASLGTIKYDTSLIDVTETTAHTEVQITATTNTTLLALMDEMQFELKDANGDVVSSFVLSKTNLEAMSTEGTITITYDEENESYVLELPVSDWVDDWEGTSEDLTENMTVYLTAETEEELADAWAALLASASYDTDAPALHMEFTGLETYTQYTMNFTTYASQGGTIENVSYAGTIASFTTWRETPTVVIENSFTFSSFHEIFNYEVIDNDSAIVNGDSSGITMRLYDSSNTLISTIAMNANEIYESYRFDDLEEGKTYTIRFYATEYYKSTTKEYNVQLGENYTFTTGSGLSGSMELEGVEKVYNVDGTLVSEYDWNIVNGLEEEGSWEEGVYVSNGAAVTSSSYTSITLSPEATEELFDLGQTYVAFNYNISYLRLNYYDANGNLIEYKYYSNSLPFLEFTFSDNEEVSYVNISGATAFFTNNGYIVEYEKEYWDYDANEDIMSYDNVTSGMYVTSTGTSTSSTYSLSDYISVTGGDVYYFGGRTTGNLGVAFYSANKTYIKTAYYNYSQELMIMPEDAAYIRLTLTSSELTNENVYIKKYLAMNINLLSAYVSVELEDPDNELIGNPNYTLTLSRTTLAKEDDLDSYDVQKSITGDIEQISEEIGGMVDEIQGFENLNRDYAYCIEYSIDIYGSEVLLDTVYFTTEKALYVIRSQSDFTNINYEPTANYIVGNDFTVTSSPGVTKFYGDLDLNGYTITKTTGYPLFTTMEASATVHNGVIQQNLTASEGTTNSLSAVATYNSGTIQDIVLNVNVDYGNYDYYQKYAYGLVRYNYTNGLIQNFSIYFETEMKVGAYYSAVADYNYGTICNGWVGGEDIYGLNYDYDPDTGEVIGYSSESFYIGGMVRYNSVMGTMYNLYSTMDIIVDYPYNDSSGVVGLLVGENYGTLENAYSYGDIYVNTEIYDTITTKSLERITNTQIVDDVSGSYTIDNVWQLEGGGSLTSLYGQKSTTGSAVLDTYWQLDILGTDNFLVWDNVPAGFYPFVDMDSDTVGEQTYIELPDITTSNLDIISVVVEEETYDYAKVIITIENPNSRIVTGFDIDGIDTCVVESQGLEEGEYRVYITISNPSTYTSQYEIQTMYWQTSSGSASYTTFGSTTANGTRYIYCDFYREIATTDDWYYYVVGHVDDNYRLTADIDFEGVLYQYILVTGTFDGKIEGGEYDSDGNLIYMYSLKNIDNYSDTGYVFYNLTGELNNIIIDNYQMTGSNNCQYAGFVRYAASGSILYNVHMQDSSVQGYQYLAGLVAYAYGATIENCSTTNVDVNYVSYLGTSALSCGSLVGVATDYTSIVECYAQDIDMNMDYVEQVTGIGGLVGYQVSGSITGCWTAGSMDIGSSRVGGITGYSAGSVYRCWSMVDIYSVGDNIGGINGYLGTSISYNVALGDVVSRSTTVENVSRVSPTGGTSSYAYDQQLLNGTISTDLDDTKLLLSQSELASVNTWESIILTDSSFDLDGGSTIFMGDGSTVYSVEDGYLPLIVDENGTAIYGQKQIQLLEDTIEMDPLESTLTTTSGVNKFTIYIDITVNDKSLSEDQILVTLDGAVIQEQTCEYVGNQSGYDYDYRVVISGYLENAWDSYLLEAIAVDSDGDELASTREKYEFKDGAIYKNISNIYEWNDYLLTRQYTFENIAIQGEISFNHEDTANIYNVALNRLVDRTDETTVASITNVTYTTSSTTERFSVIDMIVTELDGIVFSNISLDKSGSSANYSTGVIGNVTGTITDVTFENITIKAGGGSRVGCIGSAYNDISNITMDTVTISSSGAVVGGFAGYIGTYNTVNTINMTDINVTSSSYQVGGFAGYIGTYNTVNTINMTGINVIGSSYQIGGCIGYIGSYSKVTDAVMIGERTGEEGDYSYTNNISSSASYGVGGLIGHSGTYVYIYNAEVSGTEVKGRYYVGGVFGYTTSYYVYFYNAKVTESSVYAVRASTSSQGTYAGGIAGYLLYQDYIYYAEVIDCDIYAERCYAGGLVGRAYNSGVSSYYSLVDNCRITAEYCYAAGISGTYLTAVDNEVRSSTIQAGTNSSVFGSYSTFGYYVGGVTTLYAGTCRLNTVSGCTISGTNYVGGLTGLQSSVAGVYYSNAVIDSTISGVTNVGGLVGASYDGIMGSIVENCTITGTTNVGGLVGTCYSGFVSSSVYYGLSQCGVDDETTVTGTTNVGGLVGYTSYYNSSTSSGYLVTIEDCYSAATVTGETYVGGLIGRYEVGATESSWPTSTTTGAYIGTPTSIFPSTFNSLAFWGTVTGSDASSTSLWGSSGSIVDEDGLLATRIYEGSTISTDGGTTSITAAEVAVENNKIESVTDTDTSSGLTVATAEQFNTESFYSDSIANGGMAWPMSSTSRLKSSGMLTLSQDAVELYQNTDGSITVVTDESVNETLDLDIVSSDLSELYAETDELILWYDTQYNSGSGYDAEATTWTNLASAGSEFDGILTIDGTTFSADAMSTDELTWSELGLSINTNDKTNYVYIPQGLYDELDDPGVYTIEVTYDRDDTYTGNSTASIIEPSVGLEDLTYAYGTSKPVFYFGDNNSSSSQSNEGEYVITYVARKNDNGTYSKEIYSNGTLIYSTTVTSSDMPDDYFKFGTGYHIPTTHTLTSIRIYDIALDAEDIESNASVDGIRYGYDSDVSVDVNVSTEETTISLEFVDGVATIDATTVSSNSLAGYLTGSVTYSDSDGDTSETYSGASLIYNASPTIVVTDVSTNSEIAGGTVYTESPQVSVSGGSGTYTWYRNDTPDYDGTAVDTVSEDEAIYLDGKGYYYCKDSEGNYSSILVVNTTNYAPYANGYYASSVLTPLTSSEGYDTRSYDYSDYVFYDVSDNWYSGGTALPEVEINVTNLTLSTSEIAANSLMSVSLMSVYEETEGLPEISAYPSSATTINIELDESIAFEDDTYVGSYYMIIKDGGTILYEGVVEERVYSMTYDFVTDLTVEISDGYDTVSYEIVAEDMRRTVMTYGNEYYYITSDGVSTSSTSISGDFIHLMNGYGVLEDGTVYDLTTGDIIGSIDGINVLSGSIPIYQSYYQGAIIECYEGFTVLDGVVSEYSFIPKDGFIYSVPTDGNIVYDSTIVDTYNDVTYLAYLTTDGEFIDVAQTMNIPEDISTVGILEMASTANSSLHVAVVRYDSGKVVAFNYITGETFELTQLEEIDVDILGSISNFLASTFSSNSITYSQSYIEAQAMSEYVEDNQSNIDGLYDEVIAGDSSSGDGGSEESTATPLVIETEISSESEEDSNGSSGEGDGVAIEGTSEDDTSGEGDDVIVGSDDSESGDADVSGLGETTTPGTSNTVDASDMATAAESANQASNASDYVLVYNEESSSYEVYDSQSIFSAASEGTLLSETMKIIELQEKGLLADLLIGSMASGNHLDSVGTQAFIIVLLSASGLAIFLIVKARKRKHN